MPEILDVHDILALKMSHASTVIMNDRRNSQNFQNKLNTQQRCVSFVNHLDRIRVLAILCTVKSKVTGDQGALPLPQTLAVRKQLQRKTEAPSLAPSQTQLSTGDVINVSKQDEQGSKFALTACRIEDIEETLPARFRDLQYPLWVINADLFVEYDTAGFVLKWLFDVMMLGKDVIFYGEADVVHRIGRDIQSLWCMDKDKDPATVPFYHVRLLVYSWLPGPVTSSTYPFDEHCMWIGTTSRWDKQVYLLLSPVLMPLCARGLAHCCLRNSSLYITFTVAEPCVVFRWTFRRDAEQEPWSFHASDSRAVVPGQISFGQWVC